MMSQNNIYLMNKTEEQLFVKNLKITENYIKLNTNKDSDVIIILK